MARIDDMIPFLLKWETGVEALKGESNESLFNRARKRGYACDPDDRGGATMCGVTIATFTAYRRAEGMPVPTVTDLRQIGYTEWLDILKSFFWDKWRADDMTSQIVAEILVDWLWMSGPAVIRRVQKILCVNADGIVGDQTLRVLNSHEVRDGSKSLRSRIHAARVEHIEEICRVRPRNMKFRTGWLRRIAEVCGEKK